jgi:hypothetical protein
MSTPVPQHDCGRAYLARPKHTRQAEQKQRAGDDHVNHVIAVGELLLRLAELHQPRAAPRQRGSAIMRRDPVGGVGGVEWGPSPHVPKPPPNACAELGAHQLVVDVADEAVVSGLASRGVLDEQLLIGLEHLVARSRRG